MSDTMNADAFTMLALTKAINLVPYQPGLIGSLIAFEPHRQSSLIASIEVRSNRLALVPSTARGAPPVQNVEDRRELVPVKVPHFPVRDTVMADSVQDRREFGTPMQMMSFEGELDRRVTSMGRKLDVTLEFLRFGCITGTIVTRVDRDTGAPTVTVPLWDMFGIAQPPPAVFPIGPNGDPPDAASPWLANLTQACNDILRRIENYLEQDVPGLAAACGATFWDALVKHPELRDAYKVFNDEASRIVSRDRNLRRPLHFRGIDFYEYRARTSLGTGGYLQFIAPERAQIFPIGVPDLFIEAYAPADWAETVNTMALPRYAKSERMQFDRGCMLEAQMNCLPVCTQPSCLIEAVMAP
jgi:hypothetical protein